MEKKRFLCATKGQQKYAIDRAQRHIYTHKKRPKNSTHKRRKVASHSNIKAAATYLSAATTHPVRILFVYTTIAHFTS